MSAILCSAFWYIISDWGVLTDSACIIAGIVSRRAAAWHDCVHAWLCVHIFLHGVLDTYLCECIPVVTLCLCMYVHDCTRVWFCVRAFVHDCLVALRIAFCTHWCANNYTRAWLHGCCRRACTHMIVAMCMRHVVWLWPLTRLCSCRTHHCVLVLLLLSWCLRDGCALVLLYICVFMSLCAYMALFAYDLLHYCVYLCGMPAWVCPRLRTWVCTRAIIFMAVVLMAI